MDIKIHIVEQAKKTVSTLICLSLLVLSGILGAVPANTQAAALPSSLAAADSCSASSGCDLIDKYVNPLINLLSIMFGLIAVASIIMGGIQYAASEGDPQKAAQAKSRIYNTLIAIFAYLFLYAFLQFLIPGGLFNR